MKELQSSYPQEGRVMWIGIRPGYRQAIKEVDTINVEPISGLDGDHYTGKSRKRQVTLMQWEHLSVLARVLGKTSVDPVDLRRNIQIAGINVLSLNHTRFQIGDVILEGTGPCHPCSRMEENLGPGGYQAMKGHGGITCKVLQGGIIRVGDLVTWVENIPFEAK